MQQQSCVYRMNSYVVILLLCIINAGCSLNSSPNSNTMGSGDSGMGSGVQGVQVYVEPAAGESVITDAIDGAKHSIWLEMYLLSDQPVIRALEGAAHRGVAVQVMLETHPYGGGSISPRKTMDLLSAAGVHTEATSPSFSLTHEKGMIIDGQTAYIMTSNFTAAALGHSKYTLNREYGIIDTNQQEVQAISAIFTADWNRSAAQYNDPNLVVSPDNSRTDFANLINSAHKTLAIEAEEMQDSQIEQDLASAAQRGVQVQVILPRGSSSEMTDNKGNGPGIAFIKQAGVQVKEDHQLYMHAKIIVVDGQEAFVGSENISTTSLDKNRELGILVSDQNVLTTLQQTFQQDWSVSQTV